MSAPDHVPAWRDGHRLDSAERLLVLLSLGLVALRTETASTYCDDVLAALCEGAGVHSLRVDVGGVVASSTGTGGGRIGRGSDAPTLSPGHVAAPVRGPGGELVGLVVASSGTGAPGVAVALVERVAEVASLVWHGVPPARPTREWADAIHDGPVQVLAAAALHVGHALELAHGGLDPRHPLSTGAGLVDRGLEELRLATQALDTGELQLLPNRGIEDLAAVAAAAAAPWGAVAEYASTDAAERCLRRASGTTRAVFAQATREGVTNAAKHAPARGPVVSLRVAGSAALELAVRDFGPPTPGGPMRMRSGGHGLVALRRAVSGAGGTMRFGPAEGAGRVLLVTLPVSPA